MIPFLNPFYSPKVGKNKNVKVGPTTEKSYSVGLQLDLARSGIHFFVLLKLGFHFYYQGIMQKEEIRDNCSNYSSKKIKITPNEGGGGGGEDRISQLLDDILHEILSLIPFECARRLAFNQKDGRGSGSSPLVQTLVKILKEKNPFIMSQVPLTEFS